MPGIRLNGLREIEYGALILFQHVVEHSPTIEVGKRILGIELNGPVKVLDGPRRITEVTLHDSAIAVRLFQLRIQLYGFVEGCKSARIILQVFPGGPEVVPSPWIPRIQLDRRLKIGDPRFRILQV